jgi:YVTN family beta-propeller protein
MAGRTYLYAHIPLPRPGADWAKSADDKRLFVTIPRGGQLVVVDAENFRVARTLDLGGQPVRVVLQADGRYLWVGDNADSPAGGVVVLDPASLSVVARIPTGRGHHEIAFSADDRWAYVSNRADGTVTVIDVERLAKTAEVKTGPQPIALAYSRLSRALYVADGKSGEVAVLDGVRHEVAARITAKPGLGPMRFTDDGRWGFVVNTQEHVVHVLDVASTRVAYTIPVGRRPYQVALTRAFAYIRSLDSERVGMIPLSQLGGAQPPTTTDFPAGEAGPGGVGPGIAVAPPLAAALDDAAMLVANPADGNVYYYMEGMVAPMATFRNYGHRPVALTVVNRSLRETAPGHYTTTVRLPAAGTYDVGFMLDAPKLVHCFSAEAAKNPSLARTGPALDITYLTKDRRVPVGRPATFTFKLTDPETQAPRADLADVAIHAVTPSRLRAQAAARHVGDGVYEATIPVSEAGAYYVYVAVPSVKLKVGDLSFFSLMAQNDPGSGPRRASE